MNCASIFSLIVLMLTPLTVTAGACLVRSPTASQTKTYETISTWPAADMGLLLEEVAYVNTWQRHSDAVAAGFDYGDELYGETLKPGGVFDMRRVDAWKRGYSKSRRKDYLKRLAPQVDPTRIDRDLVAAVLSSCLRQGPWAELIPLDDCRFRFSAGFSPMETAKPRPRSAKFVVNGGRCEPWPRGSLDATGRTVRCFRSGNGGVTVSLETSDGSVLRKLLAPLPVRRIPDEPVRQDKQSEPITEVVTLYRSRDYRSVEFGRSCATCRLLAADVRPSEPGATIVDIGVVASGGAGHWFRCPASLRCGAPEFSPPSERGVSGCAGLMACKVWRLTDDDSEGHDTIQITYQSTRIACKNCPEGMDFDAAHRNWEQAKAKAERSCDVFPDSPPQVFALPSRP